MIPPLTAPYREILITVLETWSQWGAPSRTIEATVVIDREADTYMLLQTGWQRDRRVHTVVFHARLRDGYVWIEWDGTHPALTLELLEQGIPRDHLVLGWQPPSVSQGQDKEPSDPLSTDTMTTGVLRFDVRRRYQAILKEVLQEYEGYEMQGRSDFGRAHFSFDEERAEYLMVSVGYDGRQGHHHHGLIFHAWVAGNQVWIACDNVSPSISEALIERGIPRRDVRSAFDPRYRSHPQANALAVPTPGPDPLLKHATYRAIIQEVLNRLTSVYPIPPVPTRLALFDTRLDRYAVLALQTEGERRLYTPLVLVELHAGNVHVLVDQSGTDVGVTLTVLGIDADAIVPPSDG